MSAPIPPAREPHYIWNENQNWPLAECASGLIDTLCGFVSPARDFKGDAIGHAWVAYKSKTEARIAFTSGAKGGHVQLSVDASAWVRAEVYVSGALVLRAWVEEPWEEKEFWPDGADGVTPPDGDPPGRISKRGRWLQARRADFPHLLETGNPFFSLEDTLD